MNLNVSIPNPNYIYYNTILSIENIFKLIPNIFNYTKYFTTIIIIYILISNIFIFKTCIINKLEKRTQYVISSHRNSLMFAYLNCPPNFVHFLKKRNILYEYIDLLKFELHIYIYIWFHCRTMITRRNFTQIHHYNTCH